MKTYIYLILVISGFLPAHALSATKPRIMQISLGGHSGPSYEIIFDRRELKYYKAGDVHALKSVSPEILEVSAEKWDAFLDSLDRINAWNWDRKYINPDVSDGTTWSCAIVYDTQQARTLVSYGSNAYPVKFDEFLAAVSALLGGREFK